MKIKWHALKQPRDQQPIKGKVENQDKQNSTEAVTGHSVQSTSTETYDYKIYINSKKDIKTTISFYDWS